jgi:hypothetical protein
MTFEFVRIPLIVITLIIFSCLIMFFFGDQMNITEGMVARIEVEDKVEKQFRKLNKIMEDSLLMKQYKTNYENALIALEEHTQLKLLDIFLNMEKSPNKTTIDQVNRLKIFKDTITSSLEYLESRD